MRKPTLTSWATVVLAAILAGLVAIGKDSVITMSLASTVAGYLGLDLLFFHRWRK